MNAVEPKSSLGSPEVDSQGRIKCIVWDLDDTIWEGALLEGGTCSLRPFVREAIETLDARGILHSIASKNEAEPVHTRLMDLGIAEYFVYPQINWNSKSEGIRAIASSLNIALSSIAFIDNDAVERAEVLFSLPDVLCLNPDDIGSLSHRREMRPVQVTDDARRRRLMYQADMSRQELEENFAGPPAEFLRSLDMCLVISSAMPGDLCRAEELTRRTSQLNSTGITFSHHELTELSTSGEHRILMASLDDRFGSYGKIGLALIECKPSIWRLKLLIVSCRVISRGLGTIVLHRIMQMAKEEGVRLLAEFRPTTRNRIMHIAFRFAGFREVSRNGEIVVYEHNLECIPAAPDYIAVDYMTGWPDPQKVDMT
jgi:FkbH-like protein